MSGGNVAAVLFHHLLCHLQHGALSILSGPDVFYQRDILIPIIRHRLREKEAVVRVVGQAKPIIVCLNSIVRFTGTAFGWQAFPVFVGAPGSGFVKLCLPFPPYTERHTGGSSQIAFIGSVYKNISPIGFLLSIFTVQDADAFNPSRTDGYIGKFGIKLPHQEYCYLIFVLIQHILVDSCRHRGFEVEPVAAIRHLAGICSITVCIILPDPGSKFQEKAGRCLAGGNIRGSQPVSRQSADVPGTFQNHRSLSLPGCRNSCHDASGITAHYHHIEMLLGKCSPSK